MSADLGSAEFQVDLAAGTVKVLVRPPFALESSRVHATISVLDLLDIAARTTLEINQQQRAYFAQLTRPAGKTA